MTQTHDRLPLSDAVPCCSKCPLARLCLAGEMTQADLEKVDGVVQRRVHLRKGEPLYLIGDPVTSLYAIRVGTVKTHVTTEDGRTQVVGFHFPGELIGLDSVALPHYGSYATALEDTSLCAIPIDAYKALTETLPAMARQLFRALNKEAQRGRSLQTLLALMTAEERLVSFLLWLSEGLSARGFSPTEFILRMSREEIGSYIGLTLETVSRQFSRLAECGLIRVSHRRIELLDSKGLQAIADRPTVSVRAAPAQAGALRMPADARPGTAPRAAGSRPAGVAAK
ncbi:cyclic nucleotide-binding protein [Cupriavidus sp. IDO]|nr:helix-turn-helix domain-containing protein [Cupriavidus sp. IDO]KWR90611.1 cyclic nucleotide-binding protein [Cupriavidus sp. IDO]